MRRFFDPSHSLAFAQARALLWIVFLANAVALSGCDMLASSIYVQNSMSPEVVAASSLYASAVLESTVTETAAESPAEDAATETSSENSEVSLTVEAKILTLSGEVVTELNPTIDVFDAESNAVSEGATLTFDETSQAYKSDSAISLAASFTGSITLYFTYADENFESSKSISLTEEAEQSVSLTVYITESEEESDVADSPDCSDAPAFTVSTAYEITAMNERELTFTIVNGETSYEMLAEEYETISISLYVDDVFIETISLSEFSYAFDLSEDGESYSQTVTLTHSNSCYDLSFEAVPTDSEDFVYREAGVIISDANEEIAYTLGFELVGSAV